MVFDVLHLLVHGFGSQFKQAEQFADADKQYREKVEAKNEADAVLYHTEKALKEHGDKLPEELKTSLESELKNLLFGRKALLWYQNEGRSNKK